MKREPSDIRVLIAEDDFLVREMIQGLLRETGYTIIGEARDGRQAAELTQQLAPDVVIMDLRMPHLNGIEATRLIQQKRPTPVIMLTAYEEPELVRQASEAGITSYLLKPPDRKEMDRAIEIALARFQDLRQLKQLNDDLRASNEELNAFAHTVAHNLKSPLHLIMSYVELMTEQVDNLPPGDALQYLQAMTRNATKMDSIIDDLLLLAGVRLADVNVTTIDTSLILLEVRERLTLMIEQHDARLVVSPEWPLVLGYGPWIEEIWMNYLSNGIKYGGTPPQLELGYTVEPREMIRFWVRDNGTGLTTDEQRQLFTPFTQLSQIRNKGYGLGLSIVQRIVQKLGGEVGVTSEVGKGSTFWFSLPRRSAAG